MSTGPEGAQTARAIWHAGVAAVRGGNAVAAALADRPVQRPDRIVAVGKASCDMAAAAAAAFPGVPVLVVTRHGDATRAPAGAEIIEAAHPVPDASSLAAGARILEAVSGMSEGTHLLLLVSGGASALAEVPRDGVTLEQMDVMNRAMLAGGKDIAAMNARRRALSRIKGGGLLAAFPGARATVLAISDVEGDSIGVIGSGIGAPARPITAMCATDVRIVAANVTAREAAAAEAARLGLPVLTCEETLYGDVAGAADLVLAALDGRAGVSIWGGEPTVVLPADPGEGGRNQDLAARIARGIAGRSGLHVLVGGTDGSDGTTDAAGGLVDGSTWEPGGAGALERADSGRWLETRGARFLTGPTGTNVMDLVVAVQA